MTQQQQQHVISSFIEEMSMNHLFGNGAPKPHFISNEWELTREMPEPHFTVVCDSIND